MKRFAFGLALGVALMSATVTGCTDPAVSETIEAIDAIGEVTIESADAIETANEKYESLDSEQQEQVGNIDVLEDAKERLIEVQNEAKCVEAISLRLVSRLDTENRQVGSFSERAANILADNQQATASLGELENLELGDEFEQLLNDYILSINNQISGLEGYPNNVEQYNTLYIDEGVIKQASCINALTEQYGLALDDAHGEELEDFINDTPKHLAAIGQEMDISTEKGDVKIAFDGLVVSAQNTSMAIESGELTPAHEYASLLITLENISFDDPNIDGASETYVTTDDLFALCGLDGAALGALDSSWGYPGYEFTSSFIGIEQGFKKRFEITYGIDAGATELEIQTSSGYSVILPVTRM